MNKENRAQKDPDDIERLEPKLLPALPTRYALRLYVTGMTPRSIEAIASIKMLCEQRLAGRYELEIVDLYQKPVLGRGDQIIASPTLVKRRPLPLRRMIGNLADTERVLLALDLIPGATERPPDGEV